MPYFQRDFQGVLKEHRRNPSEALLGPQRAGAGQVHAHQRRDITGDQHSMHNPPLKRGGLGELGFHMQGIVVAGSCRKRIQILFGDRTGNRDFIAGLQSGEIPDLRFGPSRTHLAMLATELPAKSSSASNTFAATDRSSVRPTSSPRRSAGKPDPGFFKARSSKVSTVPAVSGRAAAMLLVKVWRMLCNSTVISSFCTGKLTIRSTNRTPSTN